jgi:hypothetical protein
MFVYANHANGETAPKVEIGTAAYHTERETCTGSSRAITYYRRAYAASREKMWEAGPVPRVWYQDCAVVRRRAGEWRDKAALAWQAHRAWHRYHYEWKSWLPRGWYNVGSCETGYGGEPNWQHRSSGFQGAFGFANSTWSGFVGSADPKAGPYPYAAYVATPRQQYEVALAVYRRYGLSGWGCRGAYYSWGT